VIAGVGEEDDAADRQFVAEFKKRLYPHSV
jgi:hypothetical protein